MLNETMWNIFKKTGNIHAYLYVKDYEENCCKKDENKMASKVAPLEVKEITII